MSRWRNEHKPESALGADGVVIPWNIITKPPTAELKHDQKDEDSLPPYDRLDDILHCFIEREMRVEEVVARGHEVDTVKRIWRLLDVAAGSIRTVSSSSMEVAAATSIDAVTGAAALTSESVVVTTSGSAEAVVGDMDMLVVGNTSLSVGEGLDDAALEV